MTSNSEPTEEGNERVELLYDDELDADEAERRERELDPDERAELERHRQLLGRMRSEMPREEVSDELHTSIVEQAAEAAGSTETASEREDSNPNRSPAMEGSASARSGPEHGFRPSPGSMAVAATVLLAIGATWYVLGGTSMHETQAPTSARQAETKEPSRAREEGARAANPTKSRASESKGVGSATAESSPPSGGEDADSKRAPSTTTDESDERLAIYMGNTEKAGESGTSDSEPEPTSPPSQRARAPEDEASPSDEPSSNGTDRLAETNSREEAGGSGASPASDEASPSTGNAREKKTKDAPRNERILADEDDSEAPSATGSAPAFAQKNDEAPRRRRAARNDSASSSSATPTPDDSAGVGRLIKGANESDETTGGAGLRGSTDTPESNDDPESQEPRISPSDVEKVYEASRYREASILAHKALEKVATRGRDRARIMELKALALEKLERWTRSYETYVDLADQFPDYKPTTIDAARERLADRLDSSVESEEAASERDAPDEVRSFDSNAP
jgi:hypothetical protein